MGNYSMKRLSKSLKKMPIKASERQATKGMMKNYRFGGLSKKEIIKATRLMRKNTKDNISGTRSLKIRRSLLGGL